MENYNLCANLITKKIALFEYMLKKKSKFRKLVTCNSNPYELANEF